MKVLLGAVDMEMSLRSMSSYTYSTASAATLLYYLLLNLRLVISLIDISWHLVGD
jgi:hypothetical protein